MRKLKTLLLATLALCILGFGMAAHALPRGSYLQTCRGCVEAFGVLHCRCHTRNQGLRSTMLVNTGFCGFIRNDNGHLRCARRTRRYGLPAGNYRQTCRACYFDGNTLSCQCRDRNQFWRHTSYYAAYRCSHLRNINGHLSCSNRRFSFLPRGNYRQTCRRCRFNGHILECLCKRRDQSMNDTRLFGAGHCHRVQNINGHLACRS